MSASSSSQLSLPPPPQHPSHVSNPSSLTQHQPPPSNAQMYRDQQDTHQSQYSSGGGAMLPPTPSEQSVASQAMYHAPSAQSSNSYIDGQQSFGSYPPPSQPPRPSISSSISSQPPSNFPSSETQRTLPPPVSYQPTQRPSLDSRRTNSNGPGVGASSFGHGDTSEGGWPGSSGGGINASGSGSGIGAGAVPAVPVQFDESVLRQLCDLDCALPLLTERIKQSLASCKVCFVVMFSGCCILFRIVKADTSGR